jgi:hypothetical protein
MASLPGVVTNSRKIECNSLPRNTVIRQQYLVVYFLGLVLFLERMGKVLGARVGTGWCAAAGGCAAAGIATIVWGIRVCARSRFKHMEDFTDLPLAGVWGVVVGGLAITFAVRIMYDLLTCPKTRAADATGPQTGHAEPPAAPDPAT